MLNTTTPRPPDPDVPAADRDWFGGRRWTGIGALAVIIVVVLCLVLVFTITGGRTDGGQPTGPAVLSPSSQSSSVAGTGATDLPVAPPTATPTGTTWSIYETIALPTTAGSGPAHIDGAIATGYAHTPTGALLASANTACRYFVAPDSQWRQAADAMLSHTGGYETWLDLRATHPMGPDGVGSGPGFAQINGFQFVSYGPQAAVIQLVMRSPVGVLQVFTTQVVWFSNDWKLVLAPDGGWSSNAQQVDDLAGFIEWRGI